MRSSHIPKIHRGDDQLLELEPWPGMHDRELDQRPSPPSRSSPKSLKYTQRLIANPFLSVFNCVLVFAVIRTAIQLRSLVLFLLGIGLLPVSILLLQFHCLDCGATGWMLLYHRHTCLAIILRHQSGHRRRFRGPGLRAQTIAWFYVLAALLVWAMIILNAHH